MQWGFRTARASRTLQLQRWAIEFERVAIAIGRRQANCRPT